MGNRVLPAEIDHFTPDEAAEHGERLRAWYDAASVSEQVGVAGGLMALEQRAGQVRGRHYVDWVPALDTLRSDQRDDEALELLLEIVDAAERAARVAGREPAPGYTHRAAVIYRRRNDYAAEVAVIERWEAACPPRLRGPGFTQRKLADRLVAARALLEKS